VATSNIINQRADASRSLYQICVSLKQRLAKVPGFEGYMEQLELMAADPDEGGPVESLWKLLRTGYPLLAIYNALQPETPLQVQEAPGVSEAKRSKIAILRFVEACKSKLMLPTTEVFIITDLAGNDTTGFVKVGCLVASLCCGWQWSDLQCRLPRLSTMCSTLPNNGACSSRSNHIQRTMRCNPGHR
jgi:cell division control protein 24